MFAVAIVSAGGVQFHLAPLQPEISRHAVREELIAVGDQPLVQLVKETLRCFVITTPRAAVYSWPTLGPLQPPFERTYHAVGIARRQTCLPLVHPPLVSLSHGFQNVNKQRGRSSVCGQKLSGQMPIANGLRR